MNTYIALTIAVLTGIALGLFYYTGLYFTIRTLPRVRNAALLFASSLILRLAITIFVFYLVARGGYYDRLMAGIFGFLVVRIVYLQKRGFQKPGSGRIEKGS